MQFHRVLHNSDADLAGIGGEVLAGSGFEHEDPDTDFTTDVVAPLAANQRED